MKLSMVTRVVSSIGFVGFSLIKSLFLLPYWRRYPLRPCPSVKYITRMLLKFQGGQGKQLSKELHL